MVILYLGNEKIVSLLASRPTRFKPVFKCGGIGPRFDILRDYMILEPEIRVDMYLQYTKVDIRKNSKLRSRIHQTRMGSNEKIETKQNGYSCYSE